MTVNIHTGMIEAAPHDRLLLSFARWSARAAACALSQRGDR